MALRVIDVPDAAVRTLKGRSALPRYSLRVRSNGVNNQFGGRAFHVIGRNIVALLQESAGLTPESTVLEIGCGVGRNAIALSEVLTTGSYLGVDVDRTSIDACTGNRSLAEPRFRFRWVDVFNGLYNRTGTDDGQSLAAVAAGSYDVIFLVSVFTHMLPDEVRDYCIQIGRLLRPGGRCLVTVFLKQSSGRGNIGFRHRLDEAWVEEPAIPQKLVAYDAAFLDAAMRAGGLTRVREFEGAWRATDPSRARFAQDVVVYEAATQPER